MAFTIMYVLLLDVDTIPSGRIKINALSRTFN